MSVILPADHHATFAGWDAEKAQREVGENRWSSRKRMALLVLCMLASWLLVLSPFILFG